MIDDRQEELASLHAFGLLEGDELGGFLAEIERSPQLRERDAELRRTATCLAHAAPEAAPPDSLRARIMASTETAGERVPITLFPNWVPWLAAACLGIAAIWSAKRYASERIENDAMVAQQAVATQKLAQVQAQFAASQQTLDRRDTELAEAKKLVTESSLKVAELTAKLMDEGDLARYKISTLASMLGNTPAAVAVAVWDPTRERGVLSVSKLPVPASEKDYQLWVIDKQYASPVSAGVFVVDPATGEAHIVFKADKPVSSIAKFAISVERKGGAPSPQGPIVLISE